MDDEKFKLLLLELTKTSSGRVTSCRTRGFNIELLVDLLSVDEVRFVVSHLKNIFVHSKLIIQDHAVSSDGLLHLIEELQKTDYCHITGLYSL